VKGPEVSLKARALRHLARREHSRAELERKLGAQLARESARELARGGGPPEAEEAHRQINRTLDELAARGLLSDERTAEAMLAGPGQRLGSRRLKHALLAKGLAPELVADTVKQSRATELERARELWRRRFGGVPAEDAAGRARQMRFLAGRGFDAEVIRHLLRGASDD